MSKKEVTTIGRRDFFRNATLGAGAASVAAIGLAAGKADAAVSDSPKEGAGYRESDHVKKYYELSRF
jgi:hypothetical protein